MLISAVARDITVVRGASYQIAFTCRYVSGDNVARDYFIAVDGGVVKTGVFFGSGTLSVAVTLPDLTGHWVEAWPIINRDRSIYSGELYVNAILVANSNDVHTNSKLKYYIPQATTKTPLRGIVVDGDPSDWSSIQPLLRSPQNLYDNGAARPVGDLREVYATFDEEYTYFMVILWGNINLNTQPKAVPEP